MTLAVKIRTVPHAEQRYDTAGDWLESPDGDLEIVVSDLGDWRYEALLAVHELVEALACRNVGITPEKVDRFDLAFEGSDPGADSAAPYHREHSFAEAIERLMAEKLNVTWARYCARIDRLQFPPKEKAA